jgi:hypothetical protein
VEKDRVTPVFLIIARKLSERAMVESYRGGLLWTGGQRNHEAKALLGSMCREVPIFTGAPALTTFGYFSPHASSGLSYFTPPLYPSCHFFIPLTGTTISHNSVI